MWRFRVKNIIKAFGGGITCSWVGELSNRVCDLGGEDILGGWSTQLEKAKGLAKPAEHMERRRDLSGGQEEMEKWGAYFKLCPHKETKTISILKRIVRIHFEDGEDSCS